MLYNSNKSVIFNEKEILSRLQDGEEEAFALLFRTYKDKLYSFLFSVTKSEAKAKDLVQDVFLKIWNQRSNATEIDNFNAYLFSLAQNQAIDQFRKSVREKLFEKEELPELMHSNDPHQIAENNDLSFHLANAISKLSPQQQRIFILHHEFGFRHKEIADKLNLSVSTTQNHMREALKNLRFYFSHTVWGLTLVVLECFYHH